MKILVNLIEKANDTMEEVEWYAEKAHHLRAEHKALADTYIKLPKCTSVFMGCCTKEW
jgi:hypothetical protein